MARIRITIFNVDLMHNDFENVYVFFETFYETSIERKVAENVAMIFCLHVPLLVEYIDICDSFFHLNLSLSDPSLTERSLLFDVYAIQTW